MFCCASIGDAFQLLLEPPAVFALATIAELKRVARKHLEVSLAIGGTAQGNAAFRKLADDAEGGFAYPIMRFIRPTECPDFLTQ